MHDSIKIQILCEGGRPMGTEKYTRRGGFGSGVLKWIMRGGLEDRVWSVRGE